METEGERSPTYPAIRVYYDPKPIPGDSHDWVAYFDSYEPGEPIGYGATRDGAIAALMLEDAIEGRFCKERFLIKEVELKTVRDFYVNGHYLNRARVGRQINYGIFRDGNLIGAICYALPMMRTGYFGYSSNQMIEFSRLYLAQNIYGLAVWSIAATLRRIFGDWMRKFPTATAPEIVVSWHDTYRHLGTTYKASNFIFYRLTKPRKRGVNRYGSKFRGTRTYTNDDAHIKGTWIYPLNRKSRKKIRKEVSAIREQPMRNEGAEK